MTEQANVPPLDAACQLLELARRLAPGDIGRQYDALWLAFQGVQGPAEAANRQWLYKTMETQG